MKNFIVAFALAATMLAGAGEKKQAEPEFIPIAHASFIIKTDKQVIYVDPVGKAARYLKAGKPDLIFLTHTHGDHLAPELLKTVKTGDTAVIGPKSVVDTIGYGTALKNGQAVTVKGIKIEAVAMYNTTKARLKFHPKGKGNGYVLTVAGKRIYIAGDTEDTKEMRALKNIDYAFICMNLPFTMTEEQAASAVLEFKPKVVFPYHYRGRPKFSDIEKFKKLVAKDSNIEVRFLNWYGHGKIQ